MKRSLILGLIALPLAFASCSRRGADLYPVAGQVICQGQPAVGAAVFFRRHGGVAVGDPMVMGIAGPDGRFELVSGSLGNGAPPGDYDVMVEWREPSKHRGGAWRTAPDRLAGRYADPRHPLLHATVEPTRNQLPSFELADGGAVR